MICIWHGRNGNKNVNSNLPRRQQIPVFSLQCMVLRKRTESPASQPQQVFYGAIWVEWGGIRDCHKRYHRCSYKSAEKDAPGMLSGELCSGCGLGLWRENTIMHRIRGTARKDACHSRNVESSTHGIWHKSWRQNRVWRRKHYYTSIPCYLMPVYLL